MPLHRNKKGSILSDLYQIAATLPWWIGVTLAGLAYLGIHWYVISPENNPTLNNPTELSQNMVSTLFRTIAMYMQYIIPACLLFGAISSAFGRFKRTGLVNRARDNHGAIRELSWREFEMLIGEAFRQKGFSVVEQGGGGADGGIDLVLNKDGGRYLVQCKHWKSGRVPVTVVRELLGVMVSQSAAGGYVVASESFTEEAKNFAKNNRIELIGVQELQKLIANAKSSISSIPPKSIIISPTTTVRTNHSPQCPKCGSDMASRVASRGAQVGNRFWGCSRFPKCRGVVGN